MPDFGHTPSDQPDLDAVARTDRFLDALAAGQPVELDDLGDPGDQALAALLADWRDELRWPPATALVSEPAAVAALRSDAAARRRAHRGVTLVGSVAATVLCLGGFGVLVGGAQPGDAFYGVHTALLGEPPSVHDDRIALAAKTELDKVQLMIAQGQWDQAQDKLAAVSDSVQTVNDSNRKQDLIDQVNRLNAQVQTRNPNATPATSAPPTSVPPAAPPPTSQAPTPSG